MPARSFPDSPPLKTWIPASDTNKHMQILASIGSICRFLGTRCSHRREDSGTSWSRVRTSICFPSITKYPKSILFIKPQVSKVGLSGTHITRVLSVHHRVKISVVEAGSSWRRIPGWSEGVNFCICQIRRSWGLLKSQSSDHVTGGKKFPTEN